MALSFAGEDRDLAEYIAGRLRRKGISVFYDRFEEARLWGKDLYEYLHGVYHDKARYCVILISENYVKKAWPRRERQSAQARVFRQQDEYILPVRLDDSDLPGLSEAVGYIDARKTIRSKIVSLILRKLADDSGSATGGTLVPNAKGPTTAAPARVRVDAHAGLTAREVHLAIELKVTVENTPGQLAKVLDVLKVVNIQAFCIEDAGQDSIIRLVVDDPGTAKYYLKRSPFRRFSEGAVVGVELDHRAGQLLRVASVLGKNKANIRHGYLTVELDGQKAIVLLEVDDESKVRRLLTGAGFKLRDTIEEPLKSFAHPSRTEMDYPDNDPQKIEDLRGAGEGARAEFKATLRYNLKDTSKPVDKEMIKEVCRTLAAFMNRDGGVLLIGVDDKHNVVGLDPDFSSFSGTGDKRDLFMNYFSNSIVSDKTFLGASYSDFVPSYYFQDVGDKVIFVVQVLPSRTRPVFVFDGKEFYARVGTTDKIMFGQEQHDYIETHWPKRR